MPFQPAHVAGNHFLGLRLIENLVVEARPEVEGFVISAQRIEKGLGALRARPSRPHRHARYRWES